MPAPAPAILPFSASSAFASSISCLTSVFVWSASRLTSSAIDSSRRSCPSPLALMLGAPSRKPVGRRARARGDDRAGALRLDRRGPLPAVTAAALRIAGTARRLQEARRGEAGREPDRGDRERLPA